MIIGVGIDIAELSRIEEAHVRFGEKFVARVLTPAECDQMPSRPIAYLASRFAAKEAAVKALGTGFSSGIGFQDVEICSDSLGKPHLVLLNEALSKSRELGVQRIHLSISHGRDNAVAVVVLES